MNPNTAVNKLIFVVYIVRGVCLINIFASTTLSRFQKKRQLMLKIKFIEYIVHAFFVNCEILIFIQYVTDINECTSSPCQNSAACVDDIDMYRCRCKPGYTGVNCEKGEGKPIYEGVKCLFFIKQ